MLSLWIMMQMEGRNYNDITGEIMVKAKCPTIFAYRWLMIDEPLNGAEDKN